MWRDIGNIAKFYSKNSQKEVSIIVISDTFIFINSSGIIKMRGCEGTLEILQSFMGRYRETLLYGLIVSNLDWWTLPPWHILPPSRRTCTRRVSVYQPWHKSLEAMARYYHLLPSWQTVKGTLNSLKRGGSKLPVVQDPPIMPNENLFSLPALIACPLRIALAPNISDNCIVCSIHNMCLVIRGWNTRFKKKEST